MSVSLEQVEILRARANVSFEEAKEALEKCDNDIVEALIYLERQNKVKPPKKESFKSESPSGIKRFFDKVVNLIKKGNEVKFVIRKEDDLIVNLPVNIIILITLIMPPITIIGILAALIAGYKIKFSKPNGGDMEINKTLDRISTVVTSAGSQVKEAVTKE